MTTQGCKPATHLYRRCWLVACTLFVILLAITLSLWHTSILFLDYPVRAATKQNARQVAERIISSLDDRLIALREVSHFYAHSVSLQEKEFQGFCTSIMADVPGILAILATDKEGNPVWISPANALPVSSVYIVTADPKLREACKLALGTSQIALTPSLEVPELGMGFMAATPVVLGHRQVGFIIGIFHYQSLLGCLLQHDLLAHYNIWIYHSDWPIFPTLGAANRAPLAKGLPTISPYGVDQDFSRGGQHWRLWVDPVKATGASPTNFVSLTILGLGLSLSLLLSYLAYRWQWQALLFQIQARDSQTRLERTGLNLVEIKSEMDLILNSVDEGIVIYDEQLEPVQANAAFLMAFNIAEESEALTSGHAHHEHMIQHIGSETKYWSLFNTVRNNPEKSYTDELDVQSKDAKGPLRVFLRRATTACGADGNPRGVLVIYKDMTRMKAMDRVKDEFLSNVTHELRSPLASIKGFAETIRRDPKMPPETREEFISIICEESTRLQDLIEELLDLRRMEAQGTPFKPTHYDLKVLLDNVTRSTRTVLFSKNITIKMHWDGLYDARLQGDVAQISRALRNLLVNAVKYSSEGGEIAITGHCGQHWLWVEITDLGTGIDEKDLPHIFEKFYRGARQGRQKGTGLGLAIVKNIVEQHGGHLGVRSEVGAGTTFRVELPRAFKPLSKKPKPNEAAPAPAAPALAEPERAE